MSFDITGKGMLNHRRLWPSASAIAYRTLELEIPEETGVSVSVPEFMENDKPLEERAKPDTVRSKDDEAIFDVSYNCLALFERIQPAEDESYSEVGSDLDGLTLYESPREPELEASAATYALPSSDQTQPVNLGALRNSFAIWVDFTGALSLKESSLDARLRGFTEISLMVVELLDMVYRNLLRLSDKIHPENYKLELSSVDEKEWQDALKAVGDALDRLHFLAVAIRKASAKRLEYDVNTFLTEEDALFRRDAASYVRWKFPGARKALCEQLGDSIAVRRRMLWNKRRHEKKLAMRRTADVVAPTPVEYSDSVATTSKPVHPITVSNQATNAKPPPGTATIASRPADRKLLMRHITKSPRTILTSIRSSAPSSAETSFEYPPAPRAKPHAKLVPCPYCCTPLETAKLRTPKNNYWFNHVDRDLQPYICLFPECAEALAFFGRQHEWKAHMEEVHSLDWPQKVHSLVFYCDLGHEGQDPPQFENEAEWREHMQDLKSHRGHYSRPPTNTQLNALAARKQQLVPRERYVCPLCNDIPPNIQPLAEKGDPTAVANRLTEHIAQHIKSLSLMSLPCLGSFSEEDSNSSVDEKSLKRLLHTGSNPQTPSQPSGIERVSIISLEFDYTKIPAVRPDIVDPESFPDFDPNPDNDPNPFLDELWTEILEKKLRDDEKDPILIAFRERVDAVLISEQRYIENLIKGTPTERFFPKDSKFIKELAVKAIALKTEASTSICIPDLLPKTIQVTMHQQVIYCDDSSSMKRENRWYMQSQLAHRIGQLTTRILPEGEGLALRFINQKTNNDLTLSVGQISEIFQSVTWGGDTPTGTNLRSKILQPLVYEKIFSKLERPLLITIITDGMPDPEPRSTLVDAIVECGDKLEGAGYDRKSVKFVIGQVGSAAGATNFLQELASDPKIADVAFVATGRLDSMISQVSSDWVIDAWLMELLYSPFKSSEVKKTD